MSFNAISQTMVSFSVMHTNIWCNSDVLQRKQCSYSVSCTTTFIVILMSCIPKLLPFSVMHKSLCCKSDGCPSTQSLMSFTVMHKNMCSDSDGCPSAQTLMSITVMHESRWCNFGVLQRKHWCLSLWCTRVGDVILISYNAFNDVMQCHAQVRVFVLFLIDVLQRKHSCHSVSCIRVCVVILMSFNGKHWCLSLWCTRVGDVILISYNAYNDVMQCHAW